MYFRKNITTIIRIFRFLKIHFYFTMKTLILLIAILCFSTFTSAQESYSWPIKELDTARDVKYLTDEEKDVILEINKARHNPAKYVQDHMLWMGVFYEGKTLKIPGKDPIITLEGKAAYNECIAVLKNAKAVAPLQPSRGMSKACKLLVYDQAVTGRIGHRGAGNTTSAERLNRFGKYYGTTTENIHYGDCEPRFIVISFLINDGSKNRTYRNNLLDPKSFLTGIAIGEHKIHQNMCVLNFTTKYIEE
jgi:hypothetical protein